MKVQLEIQLPKTANFVLAKVGTQDVSIPIQDLDEEEIKEYMALVCKSIKDKWEAENIIKRTDDLTKRKFRKPK